MCLVLLLAYMSFEELANFSREKENVTFVTGRLFYFSVGFISSVW